MVECLKTCFAAVCKNSCGRMAFHAELRDPKVSSAWLGAPCKSVGGHFKAAERHLLPAAQQIPRAQTKIVHNKSCTKGFYSAFLNLWDAFASQSFVCLTYTPFFWHFPAEDRWEILQGSFVKFVSNGICFYSTSIDTVSNYWSQYVRGTKQCFKYSWESRPCSGSPRAQDYQQLYMWRVLECYRWWQYLGCHECVGLA